MAIALAVSSLVLGSVSSRVPPLLTVGCLQLKIKSVNQNLVLVRLCPPCLCCHYFVVIVIYFAHKTHTMNNEILMLNSTARLIKDINSSP